MSKLPRDVEQLMDLWTTCNAVRVYEHRPMV
jgi:hypothetical protein